MRPEDVRELAAAGESFTVEFKRDKGLNDTEIIEARNSQQGIQVGLHRGSGAPTA